MEQRLSTGVPGLDELIEGGLKQRSINLVVGEAGCGKSTFATHFLRAGAASGEVGLYVSVEEQKDKFFDNMGRFGFDLAALEAQHMLIFHKASVPEIRSFLDQGVVSFEEYFQTYDIKRLVLDSVTALMLAYNSETSQRNALQMLFEMISKRNVTTLVTSEVEHEGPGRFGVEYLVDSIFRLYNRKVGQERVRTIEITKMRGTNHTKQEMVYRLGKGGILLYPGEKVLL
jgi:circadian clock protein KaiC